MVKSRRSSGTTAMTAPTACVGVVGSQLAMPGIRRLFADLPADTNAAFVLSVRSEPAQPIAAEIESLRVATALTVEMAADGQRLEPNHLYLARDSEVATVNAGQLHVAPASSADGRADSLLVSVAEVFEESAIVVVLAGVGSEGATGVAATKRCGGFAIAEGSDEDLEPEGQAVTAAGVADMRLPADRIAGQIAAYIANLVRTKEGERLPPSPRPDPPEEASQDEYVQRLETELRITKQRLQTTIEELESTDKELKSSNQEMETSKQELKAVNEQLQTVTFREITGAARAEAALRSSERRFGEAQQLAGIGVWEWNLQTDETWWSPVVPRLWGISPGDPPPRAAWPVYPEDRPAYDAALETARKTGELNAEWRVQLPDGSIRWLAESGRMESSEGRHRMLGVIQDITERKQTETRLTLLLGELQHRVRNILGVVRSIVARSAKNADSVEELAAHLDGRLGTLARAQGVFTRTGADSVDLEELIRDEMVAVVAREEQLTIAGASVRLRREAAETFALALHELTTNAVKYGALSEPTGRLAVTWRVLNTRQGHKLSLEWRESGVRALDVKPVRQGFGRELIERGLPFELGATTTLEFRRGGVRALIELPLTDKLGELGGGEEEDGE